VKAKTIEAQMRWNDRIINTIARLANKKLVAWEKVLEEHSALQDQLIAEKLAAEKICRGQFRPRLNERPNNANDTNIPGATAVAQPSTHHAAADAAPVKTG
jgi:hypothetical protein